MVYEWCRFNLRRQEEGESAASFISDVYALVEHCSYGDLHDELTQDRLVVGIRDSRLSERLQLDADLTLDKTVTVIWQSEIGMCLLCFCFYRLCYLAILIILTHYAPIFSHYAPIFSHYAYCHCQLPM